jgi:hypothetical protein
VRSKWHTLAASGLLGIFASWNAASWNAVVADDNPSDAWQPSLSPRAAARKAAANPGSDDSSDSRRLTQELLRQAMVELEANHFETARRLTRRAAALGVSAGFSGVHPEQVLAEIDRKERGAQVVVPAVSAETRHNNKAHAIELLDRGILALDEKRFDAAEQCARQAADLRVTWEKFDYRPENLLDDIRRERPSAANEQKFRPVANSSFESRPNAAAETHQPTEWANRTTGPSTADTYRPSEPVAQLVPQQPVAAPTTASAGRTPAQVLLEQAMDDLRAGRDELARQRLEQALGSLPGSAQSAPVASFGGYSAASNRPVGISPSGIMLSNSTTAPPAAPQVFFPVRRDQPNVPTLPGAADVALKPMHDPYLGDDAITTDKASPGAQTMRESMPTGAPINPVYANRYANAGAAEAAVQKVGYDTPDTPRPALTPQVQTSPNVPSLNPQIGWLEKMSTPIPPQNAPPTQTYAPQPFAGQIYSGQPYVQTVPSQPGYNPAPVAPPASPGAQWPAAGRASTPPTDPAIANAPDQPKPGFFEKMWNTISGE